MAGWQLPMTALKCACVLFLLFCLVLLLLASLSIKEPRTVIIKGIIRKRCTGGQGLHVGVSAMRKLVDLHSSYMGLELAEQI